MFAFTFIETIVYYICVCTALYYVKNYAAAGKRSFIVIPILYSLIVWLIYLVTKDSASPISFLAIILFFASPKLLFKNSRISQIAAVFLLLYATDIIVTSAVTFVLGKTGSWLFKTILSFAINMLICVGFIIIIKLKHFEIEQCIDLISKKVKIITLLSLITSALLLTIISETAALTDMYRWNIILKITIAAFIIIVGAAFPVMNLNSYAKNYYMRQSENLEKQFSAQAEHYSALAKSNFELRRFRHDYNNMKIGLSELIREGKNNEALNMLDCCDRQLFSAVSICKFDTGNNIADALLAEKQSVARGCNTELLFQGAVSNKISPTDICVIFGNALDNAIEACEAIESDEAKTIQINCECKGGFMFLKIRNPVRKAIPVNKNSVVTSKNDKKSHGFGLVSIKRVVKKYDGSLSLSCDNKEFTINVELCLL